MVLIATLIFIMSAVFSFNTAQAAKVDKGNAWAGSGQGTAAAGNWKGFYDAEGEIKDGSTSAWDSFEKSVKAGTCGYNPQDKNSCLNLKDTINSLPGADRDMYEKCKKSKYIAVYTKNNGGISTLSGVNIHPPISNMPNAKNPEVKEILTSAINEMPKNQWSNASGGTVLICSWDFQGDQVVPITLTANSGTFKYDGTLHKVEGFKVTAGSLQPGDAITAEAVGFRKEVGSGPVTFRGSASVTRGGEDVSGLYEIKYKPGKLTVYEEEKPPEGKCVPTGEDSILSRVQNKVAATNGYTPPGGKRFDGMSKTHDTIAYGMQSSMPAVGDTRKAWEAWGRTFAQGNEDFFTHELTLEASGRNITDSIRKYGGVINVLRTYDYDEARASYCQPQERHQVLQEDKTWKWTDWYNVGPEIIKSRGYTSNAAVENYGYQILGVNCNQDGFNQVVSDYGAVMIEGDPIGGGLLQTPGTDNPDFPLGKPGHYTAEDSFYRPQKQKYEKELARIMSTGKTKEQAVAEIEDPNSEEGFSAFSGRLWRNSCEDAFSNACTSEVLRGSEVYNDADNNLGPGSNGFPLFTESDEFYGSGKFKELDKIKDGPISGHGLPLITETGANGAVANFFRDNKLRMIRADVWRLSNAKVKGPFKFNEGDAARSSIMKPIAGTPEPSITEVGWVGGASKFNVFDYAESAFEVSGQGNINKVAGRSQWASNEKDPYQVKFAWSYDTKVTTHGPSRVDGTKMTETSSGEEEFDANCVFYNIYSEAGVQANLPEYIWETPRLVDIDWDKAGSAKFQFTRSVSEKSNK